jgi:hypothetical protein
MDGVLAPHVLPVRLTLPARLWGRMHSLLGPPSGRFCGFMLWFFIAAPWQPCIVSLCLGFEYRERAEWSHLSYWWFSCVGHWYNLNLRSSLPWYARMGRWARELRMYMALGMGVRMLLKRASLSISIAWTLCFSIHICNKQFMARMAFVCDLLVISRAAQTKAVSHILAASYFLEWRLGLISELGLSLKGLLSYA